jgi:hypothetical protein
MVCKGCGLEKDPSEFYAGNKRTCKGCVKARSRKNIQDNPERVKAYERSRAKDPKRMEARRQYQKTETGKAAATKAKQKYIETNPKKRSVHITTGNAIRDGKLIKGDCEVCGTTENIVAHHCDYDKPLDVMWLCSQHHSDWHAENGEALNPN